MKAVAPEEFDNPARIADAQLNDFERRQRQFAFEIGKQVGRDSFESAKLTTGEFNEP